MEYVTVVIEGYGSAYVEKYGFNYYSYISLAKRNNLPYKVVEDK